MDFSTVCRTCLSEHDLEPILYDSDGEMDFIFAVFDVTEVQMTPNDGLPQNMCTSCIDLIKQAHHFRNKCKEVQNQLLTLKTAPPIKLKRKSSRNLKIKRVTSGKPLKQTESSHENKMLPSLKILTEAQNNDSLENSEDEKPIEFFIEELSNNSNDYDSVNDSTENELISEKIKTEHVSDNVEIAIENEEFKEYEKYFILNDEMEVDIKTEQDTPLFYPRPSTSKTQRVTCKLCQKDLSIRSIEAHMTRAHPGADCRKKKCELCDNYISVDKMERHLRVVHGDERVCGYCKSEFDNKELLIQHVITCTGRKKKRKAYKSGKEMIECDVCNKQMQRASLRMHKAVKHAGLGPVCEHCGRRFGNKLRLNEHYRAKHGYDKFKCTRCEFDSASLTAMRNHERKHLGEKPFTCEVCDARFHAAYLLNQHRQSHRTEKLMKCDQCPASFKANNSLHMHKLSCHSRAAYKCGICGRAYSCRHYGVKHARQVHRHLGTPPLVKIDDGKG